MTPGIIRSAAAALLSLALPVLAHAQSIWVQHGPGPTTQGQAEGITDRPVDGAVRSVAVHPTDPAIMYVGAVAGGIWRTGNATAANPNWVPQLGLDQALSIGAIEFDPTDATNQTLMAGSGRFSSFGSGSDRVGVFRTTNGGTGWTRLDGGGAILGLNVSGVAPRGATLVLSANSANAAANRGIWRSTNTGGMWTQISAAPGTGLPAGASFDLAGDPATTTRLYTNAGTNGIYRSDDTGGTWTKVSNATVDAALAGATNVKISVGMSNNVYVAIVTAGRLSGLFRFDNGASTWATLDIPQTAEAGGPYGIHPGGQGGTHLSLCADRTNANVVYIGGDRQPSVNDLTPMATFPNAIGANNFTGRLFRVDASQPSGSQAAHITHSNTTGNSAPHADSRDMAMDANGDLVETDDGGVYKRTTPLLNTGDWLGLDGDLEVAELHDAAWDSNSKIVLAGAQDTGSPQQITPADPKWQEILQGDGGDASVDDTGTPGSSTRYQAAQSLRNFRRRTYDTANTFVSQVLPALTVTGMGNPIVKGFVTPVIVNNVTPARIIIAGNNSLYESADQGDTVAENGAGIVANAGTAIAYGATGNADMLYVGAGDNVRIRNAAPPAAIAVSATYPGAGTGRSVVAVAIHPGDPQTAFAADATHVYRTTNGGGAWTEVTGNLLTLTPGNLLSLAFSTSNADGSIIAGGFNGAFIARGPAFNVWAPVAAGLPRVPVWDLEYDSTDQVLLASTLGRGSWSVSLDERDPVDVALVLDLSGSMLEPACGTGCDTRLQVLKDAVELFVQLWTIFAIPDDRMGVDYFRTTISEFQPGGVALFPVVANAAGVIADVQSQTTVGSNLTAMGGGIQTEINRLTDATRPRNIIVFTDGMQNVNPMVNTTTFEIADEAGRPASGVAATMPPTDLNVALGRKVSTIGIGATPPFVDLLSHIAAETNGLFKLTTAPDEDLRRFYVEQLIDVLRVFSPQLVGYRYGTVAQSGSAEDFVTNKSARKIVLKLSWKRGPSNLDFTVEKDGVPLARAGRFINGSFYKIFVIDVPAVDALGHAITPDGTWRLRISGKAATPYEVAAIVEESALEYKFSIVGTDHVSGAPLPLHVQVRSGTIPVTDANVTARVLTPRQGLGTLLATRATPAGLRSFQLEPGATDAQRKYQLLLRDPSFFAALRPAEQNIALHHVGGGNYEADYTDTRFTGPYSVVFNVSGTRPDIGNYNRTESQSASVRFNEAALSASVISLAETGRTNTARNYELRVRPVDALGNYLGPDYGDRVAAFVNGTPVAGPPRDLLDGTYLFTITVPEPVSSANVKVTVMEKPLYDGALSGIPTTSGGGGAGGKFAVSAHAGATFPIGGFASNAHNGFLVELDLERRLTPLWSIEAVLGHYDFGPAPTINGLTVFAKRYVPSPTAWRGYAAVGLGAFKPQGASTELGISAALGINRAVAARTEFDAGVVYTRVFGDEDLGWLGLRAGFKWTF